MMDLYASDLDSSLLKSQLQILQTKFSDAPKPVRHSSIQQFLTGLSQSVSPVRSCETDESNISYASHKCY